MNIEKRKSIRSAGGHKAQIDSADGILLSAAVSQQPVVKRCCSQAARRGVREDMSVALARALAPKAAVLPFHPVQDFKILYQLAAKGLNYTPLSGIEQECWKAYEQQNLLHLDRHYWGLILDITGTEKIYAGESSLARQLLKKLSESRIEAKAAVAPTMGCAWAVSRYADTEVSIVRKPFLAEALADLPIESLRLGGETVETLHTLGIYIIQDLRKLPRKSLTMRFGGTLLKRLDQAHGNIEEPYHQISRKESYSVKRTFETHLVDREQLKRGAILLLEQLLIKLHNQCRQAGFFRLIIEMEREDGRTVYENREVTLHGSSEKFSHVLSVMEPVFESVPICGTISAIGISAFNITPSRNIQADFSRKEEEVLRERSAAELIDNIASRIGETRIKAAEVKPSYMPEKAGAFVPLAHHSRERLRAENYPHFDRPPLLFPYPESAQVLSLLPDHPPSRIQWRGRSYRIIRGVGPERIAAEWWEQYADDPFEERDYFKIQDETGRWLWVFRMKISQTWFVHGVWV